MINWTLFKKELKSNYKLFLIFIAVLSMYIAMIIAMYDPKLGESLNEMAEAMPQVFAAFGMSNVGATLLEFIVNYLYGFLLVVFPSVYIIILGNRLIAKYVDCGSMVYLLTTPNKRKTIAFSQMKFMIGSIFLMVIFAAGLCYVISEAMFPGELELKGFILVNVGLFGLLLFFGGICFCSSCIFNDSKIAIGVGSAVVIASILIQMVADVGDKFEYLKYATPLTLFNTDSLVAGDISAVWMFISLYVAGMIFYFIGVNVFSRKDLPL